MFWKNNTLLLTFSNVGGIQAPMNEFYNPKIKFSPIGILIVNGNAPHSPHFHNFLFSKIQAHDTHTLVAKLNMVQHKKRQPTGEWKIKTTAWVTCKRQGSQYWWVFLWPPPSTRSQSCPQQEPGLTLYWRLLIQMQVVQVKQAPPNYSASLWSFPVLPPRVYSAVSNPAPVGWPPYWRARDQRDRRPPPCSWAASRNWSVSPSGWTRVLGQSWNRTNVIPPYSQM